MTEVIICKRVYLFELFNLWSQFPVNKIFYKKLDKNISECIM